ncbi:unnamed protein product [Amoebophrya sp. A120]|nr:unnamed protein product [Amoebophrya sp. A120]|eukprot:GSA120T00023259001.1
MASLEQTIDEQHQDLTLFVQNLLKEMQSRFQTMSDGIVNRIDDMGGRIDDLEKYIRLHTPVPLDLSSSRRIEVPVGVFEMHEGRSVSRNCDA